MSSIFPQLGASSNARSIVPLVTGLSLHYFGLGSLTLELGRHRQQDRSSALVARPLRELAAMIGMMAQLLHFVLHQQLTRGA